MILSVAIAIQSGLEFLGIGDSNTPTWGSMLKDGFDVMYRKPLTMLWPALAIGLATIALALLANVMRDTLERTAVTGRRSRKKASDSAVREDAPAVPAISHEDDARAANRRGEVHGLIGESGSGKSQTSFSVLGLLPTGGRVVSGSIHFEGVDLVAGSSREHGAVRGKKIAYIPQEPMSNLDPMFTIGSQLT